MTPERPVPRRLRAAVRIVFGLVAGAVLAWLVFRGTDWSAVGEALVQAGRGWLALSLGCAFAGQFLRVQRLAFIVREHAPIPFRTAFYAAQIGMLMNVALPLRIGEGVRILVLARSSRMSLSSAAAAAVVDRVVDMAALFVVVAIAAVSSPGFNGIRIAPGTLQNAEIIVVPAAALSGIVVSLGALLSVTLGGLVLLRTCPRQVTRLVNFGAGALPHAIGARIAAIAESFTQMAGQLASRRVMTGAIAISVLAWGCGIVSLFGLLTAFGLEVPWPAPFVILSMIAAFVAAPLTPGLVGQYHVAVLAGVLLVNPAVDPATAKAVTIVGHLLFLVPIGLLGIVALLASSQSPVGLIRESEVGDNSGSPLRHTTDE